MTELRVVPVDHAAAKYAVMHWHYSKAMPSGRLVMFGIWENGEYIGAVIYGRGATPHLGDPYGLDNYSACELVRVALRHDHATPVTQLVAETLRQLRAENPGLRLVISYADPAQAHHGGIYQAGNWIYVGESAGAPYYRDPVTGRVWHSRQVSPSGVKRQFGVDRIVPSTNDLELLQMPGKHKYLMPLDRGMRRQIEKLRQPYPDALDAPVGPLNT